MDQHTVAAIVAIVALLALGVWIIMNSEEDQW